MRRMRSPCCARTTSGHAAAPPSSVMKSRRLIPCARDELGRLQQGNVRNGMGGSGSVCGAAIESRACRIWVMSARHDPTGLATHVRFPPIATELLHRGRPPLWANSCREQVRQSKAYSITSSAVNSSFGAISMPSALADLRLMTSSNLAGCTTGKSPGFSPLRMRPT